MPNYLHRTTKQYLHSFPEIELPEPIANYIVMPDLSAVQGIPSQYWVITGDVVSEMSQAEKDAVDQAALTASRDAEIQEIDGLEGNLRQIVKMMISEVNILRAQHGLADRTLTQVRAQIRNGYGS